MNAPLILVAPEGVLRVAFLTCELAHTVAVTHSQVVLERVSKIILGVLAIPIGALKSGLRGVRESRSLIFETRSRDSVSGQDAYSCFIDGEATVPLSTTSGTAW
jgi:hypothetical protein